MTKTELQSALAEATQTDKKTAGGALVPLSIAAIMLSLMLNGALAALKLR